MVTDTTMAQRLVRARRKIGAAGIGEQLDFEFTVKSRYDMTLSFGYAVGFLDSTRQDEEYMVSLKIL